MSTPRSSSIPAFCLATLLVAAGGCSGNRRDVRAPAPAPAQSTSVSAEPASAHASSESVHAVLALGGRAFVLLGETPTPGTRAERVVVPGGWALEVRPVATESARTFTLVGPRGRCVAAARRGFALAVDLGGYSGARMAGASQAALELGGCVELAQSGFVVALDGDDANAQWVHPAHVDDAPAPADRRLGENEASVHRFLVPGIDVEIVERSVLSWVSPTCSEEARTVILVDETSRPLENHPGFSLLGAIRSDARALVVMTGHADPQSLRVLSVDPITSRAEVALDTRFELFADAAQASC